MRYFMSAVRIGLCVAIINGTARAGLVYWSHYQLKDAAQQLAVFGWQAPPEVLRSQAVSKASELFIPLTEEQVVVTRNGPVTLIQANYEQVVEYFPHRKYPLKLSFIVEGRNIASGTIQ